MENEQCCTDAVWEKLFVLYSKHPALPAEIHLLLPEVIFFLHFISRRCLASFSILLENKDLDGLSYSELK